MKKKLIIALLILGALVGLWYWGSTRGSLLEDPGKLATAAPGRVNVPINANGEAREQQRIEVKAEASGNIIEVAVKEGDIVQPEQLLLRIDEEEEQRNVDKAQAALDQAQESLAIAELAHEQALEDLTTNADLSQAALDSAQARYDFAEFEYERFKELAGDDHSSKNELMSKKTTYLTSKAELNRARADLKKVQDSGPRNVQRAAREIEQSKARLRSAQFTLSDAQRRLRKTQVVNSYPSPCRVVRVYVSEGQVAQSAVSVVGAGTPMMELADISAMEVEAQVDESDIDQVVTLLTEGDAQRRAAGPLALGEAYADAGPLTSAEEPTPATAPADEAPPRFSDEVMVEFDALPRDRFRGRIVEIAQKPRNLAQIITYPVRIRLYDSPAIPSIRLGMQCKVDFSPLTEEGLCAPYEAVHKVARERYVVKMPDPADPRGDPLDRPVEVGLTDGRKVVIRSGLKPGEKFYTKLPTRFGREKK